MVFAQWWFHYRALTQNTQSRGKRSVSRVSHTCECLWIDIKQSEWESNSDKSIKEQRHDTHLYVSFLLQHTPEHIWNSVCPDAKRAFCRAAREGESERKAKYLFTFSGLLTCIFLTAEPFGKAVSSTSKYTMFRATRRTEIACKQHGWKQTKAL